MTLLIEPEVCDAHHPKYGRCAAIRSHGSSPLAIQHGNAAGQWFPGEGD